jgi:hypothetical protein
MKRRPSNDDRPTVCLGRKAKASLDKLTQPTSDHARIVSEDDPERTIEELKKLSGQGHSRGWRFNRDEIHDRAATSKRGTQPQPKQR